MVDRCGRPGRVVVIRRVPVGDLLGGFDQFAVIAAAGAMAQRSDVTRPHLPSGVGHDGLWGGPVEGKVHFGLHHRTNGARVLSTPSDQPRPSHKAMQFLPLMRYLAMSWVRYSPRLP